MPWRDATSTDHVALSRFMRALYDEDPSPEPMTQEKIARTLKTLSAQPERGRAVVLEVDDEIGGYALLCAFWSNELGGEICVIDELYVAPHRRGHGHGATLVSGLVERRMPWFQDAVAFDLEVTPENHRARALYKRLGFRPHKNQLMRRRAPTTA